jgi:hypothetical protein
MRRSVCARSAPLLARRGAGCPLAGGGGRDPPSRTAASKISSTVAFENTLPMRSSSSSVYENGGSGAEELEEEEAPARASASETAACRRSGAALGAKADSAFTSSGILEDGRKCVAAPACTVSAPVSRAPVSAR